MWTLARKIALLALPFLLYSAAILWLDPFRFFNLTGHSLDPVRRRTALPLNQCIWKMSNYSRKRSPNILLGDSRIANLPAEEMTAALGEPVFNLAYGAATINEVSDSFWYANSIASLHRVWIGVNFNQFSDYARTYRTAAYQSMQEDPLLYFTNRTVMKAAAMVAYYGIEGGDPKIGLITSSPGVFWEYVLGTVTEGYYSKYVEPVQFRGDLKRMADYCHARGIRVTFVIPPGHTDLQKRVADFHLEAQYAEFKRYLGSLGETYDYDYPNEMTSNAANFHDPMHCNSETSKRLAAELASGNLVLGRRIGVAATASVQ